MTPRPVKGRPPLPHHPAPDDGTEVIHGVRAALAVFDARRDDIVRVMFAGSLRREVGDLARWAKAQGIPCVEATPAELERVALAAQHEGLCVVARARRWATAQEIGDLLVRSRGVAVALDRVRNPYNVGAILRSAAFFGLDAAILGAPAPQPGISPMAARVAEGGAEHLRLARTTDLADTLARLRARGVRVIGADAHATAGAFDHVFEKPALLVVGHEREGLGDRVRAQCDTCVAVRGAGRVDSLNVGVAAGVLIAAITRSAPKRR